MSTIGLALSGGGFRATLYHLGVIRYLRDSGSLPLIGDIAAVSGGSILAAHLVLNWDRYNGTDAEFAEAAGEVIRFVQHDVRNRIVRRLPLLFPIRLVGKLTGWSAANFTPNALLEKYYRTFLYGDRRLFELPEQPALHMLATNVSDGVMAVFNREGLHIQKRERGETDPFRHIAGQTATIAKVVSASSAFPGFFPPVEITAHDLGVHEGQFPTESFTDGGVYDNLGIRGFAWLTDHRGRSYHRVIVSDAGKPFQILGNAPLGFIAQSIRATDILWDRVWQLERENFGDQNGFHFLPVTHVVDAHEDPHGVHPVVQAEVSGIRTDLDRFNDLEANALVAHGYEVARSFHRRIGAKALRPIHDGPPWEPLPGRHSVVVAVPQSAAHGTARTTGTSPPARLAELLRRSSHRKVWATLLDWKDWPSYLYLALGLLLFVYLPVRFYTLHRRAEMLTSVIDSIAKGDPDIRLVLDLVESDPVAGWQKLDVSDAAEPTVDDYAGVEILSYSRINDLRTAWSGGLQPDRGGQVRFRDRVVIRLTDDTRRQKGVVFRTALPVEGVDYRQPNGSLPGRVRRVKERAADGTEESHYEYHVDLSDAPVGEPVPLEVAAVVRYKSLPAGRLPLVMQFNADLLTVWILFPDDHPYHRYQLVTYPRGQDTALEPLTSRYTIDHPYGRLIGWSVIMPRQGSVYECRWSGN
ncbi:MAG: patatin-like phospholipase family protein [Planctomycetota bacterium]|jgi:predicted acylesterase/phospholipase RssA